MLPGIGDRCRTADEDRIAAVETADPDQASEHIRQMRAEDSPTNVEFIDHHVLEVRKELLPFCMVGKDTSVEHVGVRNDNMTLPGRNLAYRPDILHEPPVFSALASHSSKVSFDMTALYPFLFQSSNIARWFYYGNNALPHNIILTFSREESVIPGAAALFRRRDVYPP